MARKNVLKNKIATAQTLAASFNSLPTMIPFGDNCAYQVNVTTTNSTGTFSVQGSLDYVQQTQDTKGVAGNWIDLSLGGGTPTVAAANDTILINLNQLPFNAVRIAYTSTIAGTGTADIYVMEKQIGG